MNNNQHLTENSSKNTVLILASECEFFTSGIIKCRDCRTAHSYKYDLWRMLSPMNINMGIEDFFNSDDEEQSEIIRSTVVRSSRIKELLPDNTCALFIDSYISLVESFLEYESEIQKTGGTKSILIFKKGELYKRFMNLATNVNKNAKLVLEKHK